MPDELKPRVLAATVRLPMSAGRGVLVRGGLILRAAHCCSGDGAESIETADGRRFRALVQVAERVADIAALGAMDGAVNLDDKSAFNEFAQDIEGLRLCFRTLTFGRGVPGWLLTHKDEWVACRSVCWRQDGSLTLEAKGAIVPRDSGSPVVDHTGRLVGVVSNEGSLSFASRALPAWRH